MALFVNDPESVTSPDAEALQLTLGLTPREAQLLPSLVAGQSLSEMSERLSIKIDTARKRLKAIFPKTDTHRQAELVRLAIQCGSAATIVDPNFSKSNTPRK